jgi:uncharacterized protein Yka (UPF0111/DUF47 family)
MLLRDVLADYPESRELTQELREVEHEGDRLTHDIIHRLRCANGSGKPPLEPGDGHTLASAVDDIVDYAEQAGDELFLYGVEAPMEQARQIADVLVEAADQVARALGCLRSGDDPAPYLVEIHRLENEGDRLNRDGVASLFATGIDPMVVIRWKGIYDTLEAGVDACETVAHVIEGIMLKLRRR